MNNKIDLLPKVGNYLVPNDQINSKLEIKDLFNIVEEDYLKSKSIFCDDKNIINYLAQYLDGDKPNYNIEKIELSDCSQLKNKNLQSIYSKFPNLKVLDMFGGYNITDDVILFIDLLQGLQVLNLHRFYKITNKSIIHISKIKTIHTLDLYCCNITDFGIKILSKNLPNLEKLDLSDTKITQESIKFLALLPQLKTLSIKDCKSVKDAEFNNFVALTSLNISGCHVTEETITSIAKLSNLTSLNLSFNYMPDNILSHISKLSKLKRLNLTYCNNIENSTIESLSNLQLTDLSIKENNITDDHLSSISKIITLEKINLSHCHNITEKGVNYLLNNCPKISSLIIYGCKNISFQYKKELQEKLKEKLNLGNNQ